MWNLIKFEHFTAILVFTNTRIVPKIATHWVHENFTSDSIVIIALKANDYGPYSQIKLKLHLDSYSNKVG